MAFRFYPLTIPWEDISKDIDTILKKTKKGKKRYPWNVPWERISEDIDFINIYGVSHKKHDENINRKVENQDDDQTTKINQPPIDITKKWEHLYQISEDIDFIE